MNNQLTRYWFIIYPQDRYGPRNIGVTAYSKDEARSLIMGSLGRVSFMEQIGSLNENAEVIENIDIQILDQNHVIPNMGVVTFKGIWFPNLE